MDDEERLRRALFAHIEQKTDELWKSIDDLQKALEAVPTPELSGPEWGRDGKLSERFIELMKRLGDLGHQFRLGLAAIDESTVSTKH
jgi:hypothetical protein